MKYLGETDFRHDDIDGAGVLLANLGTPAAPNRAALRRYLKEFLSDPRVVEFPRWLWWLILNGVILNLRPAKSAHAYQAIWTEEGSPLLTISRRQTAALQQALDNRYPGPLTVALGMRYGSPSIADGLDALWRARCRRILVLPLYPQYSGSTTGSVFDAVADVLSRWRWVPEIRFVNAYHDRRHYINALAAKIERHWAENGRGQRLLFSFHGVPRRYLLAGDPYHCHCQKTARLVAEALGLRADDYLVVFQSRFGREEWLQPYCDQTLKALPGQGVRHVDIVCPGFSADCLETLEEINQQNRALFVAAGGERYEYIACLNDDPAHIAMMSELVDAHIQGWPERHDQDRILMAEERLRLARAAGAER